MKTIIFLILVAAAVLVSIWFKDGYILGTAEDGLIFYKISHYKPEADFAWMEHPGLGRSTLYLTASKPTYTVLTWLQDNGIPGYIIQAGVLWFILLSSAVGMYLLTKELFPNLPKRYLMLSVLFYWFNPISLVIWNRFLLNYLFFFGMLPLVSFLFIKGLKTKNYIWGILLILFFLFYSYSFSYFAFFILIWLVFFFWTLFHFLVNKDRPSRLFYVKYFLLTVVLFIFTNSWWISQLIGLNLLKDFNSNILNFNTETNLGILNALSKKMGNLADIFRLNNASFFQDEAPSWVRFFYSIPIIIAEFLVALIVFYSIIKNRKNTAVLILAGLLLTSIFLVKGTNPPFGEVYKFIYERLPFFQIFRNPFEKFGYILSLSAAPLLCFGVFTLVKLLPQFGKLIYLTVLSYIFLIWGFPFYTGLVFTSKEAPANNNAIRYKVKVPSYYDDADKWLITQGNNFRFIGFPLGDEGITYNWEKGYSGVELSTALFSTPGILHNTAVPYYHQLVPGIEKTLLDKQNFYNLANILNARYFFVREDIDFKIRKMTDPQVIKESLILREKKGEIKKAAEFGKLTFWENLNWKDATFYPANIIKVSKDERVSDLVSLDSLNGEVLTDREYNSVISDDSIKNLKIKYERINPAKYVVHIQSSQSPFILVFSELFNNGWEASFKEDNKSLEHSRVNNYANGWLIEKKGNFNINVEFSLQRWLEVGEKISLFSYSVLLVGLLIYISKRKFQKRKR